MGGSVRHVEVSGRAAPQVAWERYADLDAWPTWAPQIRLAESPGRRLAVGLTGTVRVVGGLGVPFVVTAVDPVRRTWSWIARLGPVALTLHHDLTPLDPPDLDPSDLDEAPRDLDSAGTRAGLTLEGPALLVAAYAPLTRAPLALLVQP